LPESSALTAVCREPNYGLRHVAIGTRHKTFAHIEIFDFLHPGGYAYFVVYTDLYHHPPEDMIFETLKVRDSIAAATIGDIAADHRVGAERLHRVAQAIESVLADRDLLRQAVNDITRDFIEHERRHIAMEERDFFPAAVRALQAHDWTEIASRLNDHKDPLFSEGVEHRFEGVRRYILQLEQEAEAERA